MSDLWFALREDHFKGQETWFDVQDIGRREFALSAAQAERLRVMAYDLEAGNHNQLTSEAFLHGVISLLANASLPGQDMPDWMEYACTQIAHPRHFPQGTAEFARLAGRSPEHVAREVKRVLGKTPTDIVNEARMNYASQQLSTTMLPIVEVAAQCGFENLGHFYKIFRARFGTSPSRYRKYTYKTIRIKTADRNT